MLAILLAACKSAPTAGPVPEAPAPQPAPPAQPPAPTTITDEECVAKGGRIVTEQTYAYLDRRRDPERMPKPFRACWYPSPANGKDCRGDADCSGGRCYCTGDLGRPDPQRDPALRAQDGKPATGRCSDEPIPSGSWYCLVVDGKARLNGIIVD